MASTPRKSTIKHTPKGKVTLPLTNGETPKKVRFSVAAGSEVYTAQDVISMLNDNSLSEIEDSSSDEEWIVTKAKSNVNSYEGDRHTSNCNSSLPKKEADIVSPLKLLRKPEYEVNKAVKRNKKSESAVSPIVIKRKTDSKKTNTESQPLTTSSKYNTADKELRNSPRKSLQKIRRNQDESDTENEVVTPVKSTPSKGRSKSKSLPAPPSSTKRERRQFDLESSDLDGFEDKISKLKLTDTPVKPRQSESDDDKPLAIKIQRTPGRRQPKNMEAENIEDLPLYMRLEKMTGRRISQNTDFINKNNESPFKKRQDTPGRRKSQRIDVSGSENEEPLIKRLQETPGRKIQLEKMEASGSENEEPLVKRLQETPAQKTQLEKMEVSGSENEDLSKTPGRRKSHKMEAPISPDKKEVTITPLVDRRTSKRTPAKKKIFDPDDASPPKRRSTRGSQVASPRLSSRKSSSQNNAVINYSELDVDDPESESKIKNRVSKAPFTASDVEIEEPKSQSKRKSTRKSAPIPVEDVDVEFDSPPEVKKTPRRSTIKARQSFVDSPDLRKQLLTPRVSARKKLDMSSPASIKKVGSGFLSPVVHERARRNILGTPTSHLAETRASLHTSNIPSSLPCRENEFQNILKFLSRKIEDKAGGCMYISGVPGTGKTATVHAVVRSLQKKVISGDIPKFDFIEINALRLTEPRQAYTRIWKELSGEKLSSESALKALEKKFTSNNKRPCVILVDELDYLCNRRQDVIYNILEWSTKSTAALTVLTIANTMDLPERTLKGKVTSRMGLTRLVFQPYTFQQLQTIVMNRIGDNSSFHVDAVQLVARKVAAVSGDARRALDICRRVTEMVSSDTEVIKVTHIEKAISQIFAGTRVQAIKRSSIMCQYLLRAMRDEFQRTGVEESTVGQVYSQFVSICAFEGCEAPSVGVVLSLCTTLADSGLILAEKSRNDLCRKISLNVSADDIFYACDA